MILFKVFCIIMCYLWFLCIVVGDEFKMGLIMLKFFCGENIWFIEVIYVKYLFSLNKNLWR